MVGKLTLQLPLQWCNPECNHIHRLVLFERSWMIVLQNQEIPGRQECWPFLLQRVLIKLINSLAVQI